MENACDEFMKFVKLSLVEVDDDRLKCALLSGFDRNLDLLLEYRRTYGHITSNRWARDSLCTFFCGWRSPEGAANAVSSIIVRILQESSEMSHVEDKLKMLDAAWNCGEIIVEDVGLGELHHHPHHSKLYYRMASDICGSDDWRLQDRFLDPVTKEFSAWVEKKRPLAPDLMEALEMLIMTEIFNTGEYNLMAPMWRQCLREHYGYTALQANKTTTFLSVHCGDVEARHFRHAANALTLYAAATGQEINFERIRNLSHEYVTRACEHLGKMASVLKRELAAA